MAAGIGIGASLASLGQSRQREAMQMLGQAADAESQRNMANQRIEQQTEAGNRQLGATIGSTIGMGLGGPIGSLVGGAIGTIAGGLI